MILGLSAWVVVAVCVAVVLGRVVARRDKQVPTDSEADVPRQQRRTLPLPRLRLGRRS